MKFVPNWRVGLPWNPIKILITAVLLGAIVYVACAWSPSSYQYAFDLFGLPDLSPAMGKARAIRSDEWAVITPLMQATVNNHLARYNLTSPYQEDLRSVYSMPLADWGIIFKPDMWLFSFANPAIAFSYHHYFSFAVLLIGYALLFANVMGLSQLTACLLSALLFFTGYVQYWWTTLGPTIAIFPWLIVVLDWQIPRYLKFLLFYWLATVWMLAFFYPPTIISLAFVGFLIICAFRPTYLKRQTLIYLVLASVAAAITTVLYLQDYLASAISTVYPGQRIIELGGGVPLAQWLSQFFPISQIHRHQPLLEGTNICEISTVGTVYTVAVLCLLNYTTWKLTSASFKRAIILLTSGLLLTWMWILTPLPSWLVVPLLWNRVQPSRMLFASGLLLLMLIAVLAEKLGLKITRTRIGILAAITICFWIQFKLSRSILEWLDIIILVAILLFAFVPKMLPKQYWNTALLTIALAIGVAAFGTFNPVQSAWSIFNRPTTNVTQRLDQQAAQTQDGVIAVIGFPGATLNGWGYRSISHVLLVPQFDFFRPLFPDLSDSQFNHLFNRYAHIQLTTEAQPALAAQDALNLPVKRFSDSKTSVLN
ncbi:MAG: hypothetical protein NW220_23670 [Leptolyngbyaceae cyanobacterium bins.349]|nr:hypothetical protein [Leptolyngbyaceae cyanobacterium bins.349]